MENIEIMDQILRLARVIKRRPHEKHERSHSQRNLIRYIVKHPGCRTSELTEVLDIRPSSLTELLDKLDERGDIIRKKDEQDKRVILIYPSEDLLERIKQRKADQSERHADFESVLTEEEKKEFNRLCNKLYDYISSDTSINQKKVGIDERL